MVAHPDGMLPLDHVQDVLPALAMPSFHILRRYIGNKIDETAFAAAMTGRVTTVVIHVDSLVSMLFSIKKKGGDAMPSQGSNTRTCKGLPQSDG